MNISLGGVIEIQTVMQVVQSFINGHRKSGVISIKHSRDIRN